MSATQTPPVLSLTGVSVQFDRTGLFKSGAAPVLAVDGVNLTVGQREIVALIGGSGSGKTTTVRTALGLQAATAGQVAFSGRPLETISASGMRELRRRMQFIFQDPSEALNPRMSVQQIIMEGLDIHHVGDNRQARIAMAAAALAFVDLTPADLFMRRHLHTLSGGQRQRVAIAAALVLEPDLVIADEPVSMLDLSVRASVLELFRRLRAERGMSTLLITHDLASVRHLADRIYVMDRGRIVEEGQTANVFGAPKHNYTKALLAATAAEAQPNHTISL
ncbi:Oligopeptide transport ATP-binding protein OppF [Devosia sp. LC5]|uniref:ABC transporter ATP-binding protein n=1 Tax=Devosia sp. LC5 TaxID=1502724 RepID=UPI0004E40040|nr:dipeptide/oligopeptide/nickel ABC transporter ATP-binding protein [Devosia sp. LC5]KFC67190.1 Oligopeptide transport ATP-binding protein OppF [Devosia sp. LC5]